MAQIKIGDDVRAHLDANYKGKVLDIVKEKHSTWCSAPLDVKVYCIVELSTGQVVKTKITDLYKVE
jgi:hypothetical protein